MASIGGLISLAASLLRGTLRWFARSSSLNSDEMFTQASVDVPSRATSGGEGFCSANLDEISRNFSVNYSGERPSIEGKEMKELLKNYSDRQIFDLISRGGVTLLGSLKLREGVVMKAFGNEKVLWEMHDQAEDAPWKEIWENRLLSAKASTQHGPTQYWKAMAYVVTLKHAALPFEEGLLHPIVAKLESGKCPPSLFSAPLVRAVVWFKWHWARRVIFVEFLIFLVWLTMFLLHATSYHPDELHKGFWTPKDHFMDHLALTASLVSTIFMLPFSYISTCEVIYNGLTHWLTFWNLFDALAQICQMACFIVFFFGLDVDRNVYSIMLGTQTVLLVLKIQYFARAVLAVEVAFIDNLNQVLREAAMFLFLWATTVISFAIALYVIFKHDLDIDEDDHAYNPEIKFYYGWVGRSIFTLFGSMFKRFTYDPLLESERSISVTAFFSVFLFLNTVTFYNLIASIVVSSHKKIKERSQARLDTGRAHVLVELETATPRYFLKRLDKSYIHFLKLIPAEDIDMNKLWMSVRYAKDKAESQKEALSRSLHEAETEIMHEIEFLSRQLTLARTSVRLRGRPSQ